MKIISLLLVFFLSSLANSIADAVPEGGGIMYDANYSFVLTAPKGWTLDNTIAKDQGVCAVFYPTGSTWKDSAVVFYVNTKEKSDKMRNAQDAVNDDMTDFHRNGSPNSKAEKVKEIKLKNGRIASIWQYTGDQWGNYERTAFVVEDQGISAIVMSAHTQKDMDGAIPAFEKLVSSYEYMGTVKIEK